MPLWAVPLWAVPLLTVRRPSGPRARRLRDIIEYPHSVVTSRGYAALKGRRERQRPAKTARPAVSSILSAVRGHGWLNGCSARKGAGPQRPLAPCVANPHRGTKLVRAVLASSSPGLSLLLCVPRARVEPRRAACTMRCTQSQCAQVRSTISLLTLLSASITHLRDKESERESTGDDDARRTSYTRTAREYDGSLWRPVLARCQNFVIVVVMRHAR